MNRRMTMTLALASMMTLVGCGAPPAVTASEDALRFDGFLPGSEVSVRGESQDGLVSVSKVVAGADGSFTVARAGAVAVTAAVDGVEVLRERLQRYSTRELMPVADPDVCGGLACPEPEPLIDLPRDPAPLPSAGNTAADDLPEDPCGGGPRPSVGPQPLPLAGLEVATSGQASR